jgi:carbonic anhydrase/acetyltransferase-like protein (isoleucine patch superfamily)
MPFEGAEPSVAESAWVAPTAELIGDVTLHAESSVWYTAVLRADFDAITIGPRSNLQDGVVVHTDTDFPTVLAEGVSVGHRAVLHRCHIEDNVLIGWDRWCSTARGSVGTASWPRVPEGAVIPSARWWLACRDGEAAAGRRRPRAAAPQRRGLRHPRRSSRQRSFERRSGRGREQNRLLKRLV